MAKGTTTTPAKKPATKTVEPTTPTPSAAKSASTSATATSSTVAAVSKELENEVSFLQFYLRCLWHH